MRSQVRGVEFKGTRGSFQASVRPCDYHLDDAYATYTYGLGIALRTNAPVHGCVQSARCSGSNVECISSCMVCMRPRTVKSVQFRTSISTIQRDAPAVD